MNVNEDNVKTDARILRTKRDLANSLEELLQEKNFDDLSVKDITDHALISKNTFYNNFNDKNDLLQYLFRRYRDNMMKEIEPFMKNYIHLARKPFLKKATEKVVHFFYISNLPLNKMVQNDASKAMFWNINRFVRDSLSELSQKYNHIVTNHVDDDMNLSFYSGGLSSIIYFSFQDEEIKPEEAVVKDIVRLLEPATEKLF